MWLSGEIMIHRVGITGVSKRELAQVQTCPGLPWAPPDQIRAPDQQSTTRPAPALCVGGAIIEIAVYLLEGVVLQDQAMSTM